MIEIDGAQGEGGGAVLRTALALSCLTGKGFRLINIRKNRPKPGLMPQHLSCVEAAGALCKARVSPVGIGSAELVFEPGEAAGGNLRLDIGTAGSVTLLVQALLLPAMFGRGSTRLALTGGTDVNWSMPFDYFYHVLAPVLSRYAGIKINLVSRGYYPIGGGGIEIDVVPNYCYAGFADQKDFRKSVSKGCGSLDLVSRGRLARIQGLAHASANLSKNSVAERMASAALGLLRELGCEVMLEHKYYECKSTGCGISLFGELDSGAVLGASALGEKGKEAEQVGRVAAECLVQELQLGGPVDRYLADQLIPLMAVIGGRIRATQITEHTRTNILVTELFVGKIFKIDEDLRVISAY